MPSSSSIWGSGSEVGFVLACGMSASLGASTGTGTGTGTGTKDGSAGAKRKPAILGLIPSYPHTLLPIPRAYAYLKL